jgi:tetratricopeptide (TPR) repeat protein
VEALDPEAMTRACLAALLGLLPPEAGAIGLLGPDAALQGAQSLFDEGKYAGVVERLSGAGLQAVSRGRRSKAYCLLGASYERLGRLQDALGVYQLAEGLYPKDLVILTNLANILHRIGLDDRARPRYEQVLSIHPNNAESHVGLGGIFRSQGFLARAQTHYELALREWKDCDWLWRDLAEVLAERRNYPAAIGALRRALALNEDPDSLIDMAAFQREVRDPEAFSTMRRALEKGPARSDARLRLGLWLLDDGRLDEALAEAEAALALQPGEPLGFWLRASVSLRRGKAAAARADLEAAALSGRTHPFIAGLSKAMLERLGP